MAKPEIRLKGFEGEWKNAQLDACVIFLDNLRKPVKEGSRIKGIYPYYGASGIVDYINEYIFDEELILLSEDGANITDRNYPVCFLATGKFWVNNHAHVLKAKNGFINSFLSNAMERKNYTQYNTGMAMPKLNKEVCKNIPLAFPSVEEQQLIANYFKSLYSMIQGVTKKITSLKQMKQACLVSMFPQEGETMPRVRFKGFKGEWLNVELSECLSVCKDRNLSETYGKGDVLSVSDDYGVVNQIELLGRSYAGKSVANYRILRNGHIVYTKSPLKVKPFGIIKVNNGSDGIVSTLYAVYVPMDWVSAKFINYYFEPSFRMNKYIHPLVNKGAKNDMKVSDENVLKGNIFIPKEKEEQEKIATYFTSLDKQISLQEARLEKLKQIKSACLDKMFV